MPNGDPIALTILTGFLGAGKTTLLNRLLKDPALTDTAVVVNEFGEVAIDHLLVEQASDGVIELGGGCLCCTVRGELADTLSALAGRERRPRRVVVETSGLADPGPVLQAVTAHPVLSHCFRLEAVIAVVDAVNGAATLDTYEEARSQVAVADRIIVTKADLAAGQSGVDLTARLASLNPHAEIIDSRTAAFDAEALLRPGFSTRALPVADPKHAEAHDHHDHHHHHHEDYRSVSLTHDRPLPQGVVESFLDLLASQQGENILRIKGLVKTVDDPARPLLVQGAQRLLHAPERLSAWPARAPRETNIVVIGRALDKDYVRRIFAAFTGQAAVDTPDRAALEENPLSITGFRP